MWTARKATFQDYRSIKPNLAARLEREFQRAHEIYGINPAILIRDCVKKGDANSLLRDDLPLAIFTWLPAPDGRLSTGFWAEDAYFSGGASALRFSKHHIRNTQRSLGNVTFLSDTLAEDPHLFGWYKWLGFTEQKTGRAHRSFELSPI